MDDEQLDDAAPAVVIAVAAGVAALPFLAVYAVLFITRGTVRPVIPPDVGTSKGDELLAGLAALALLIIGALAAYWFLDRRRRWLFVVGQLAVLGGCIFFIVDSSTGSLSVPVLLLLTSLLALVLAAHPSSWQHLGQPVPTWIRRRKPAGRHELVEHSPQSDTHS